MPRALIETYGCTLNQTDSEIMESLLKSEGFEVENGHYLNDSYDYVIVNTCTVKTTTEQKILDRLRRMRNLGNRLVVTGCLATANKDKVASIVPNANILTTSNITRVYEALIEAEKGKNVVYNSYNRIDKARYINAKGVVAKIPISEGCLSSCGFCETKFARGPLNSFSEEVILKAIEMSTRNGAKEVELTSQDIGAYGFDKKTNIAELLSRAIEIEGNFRIRVGMLNPEHLHKYIDELIGAYKSKKLYRFIHLPVQSGSNRILRDMKRRYSIEEFNLFVEEFRRKADGISIATDIMVGYPTETVYDFEESITLIEETRPSFTNVSKFGARPHAKASKLRQLDSRTIDRRSIEMSRTARKVQNEDLSKIVGRKERILITEENERSFVGRDDSYRNVALMKDEGLRVGDTLDVEITGNTSVCLLSKAV